MQLLGLRLAGFKSFAQATELRFDRGLTAIIGPNGSGKSNIAEAVRWVLGEQSSKQLRARVAQDVLFAGNAARGRAHRAEVELLLANESGRFPLAAAEISIIRAVEADGVSQYLVNGETVRLVDLQRMIAESGIGAKSYTVISQGMVDKYINATAAVRRELFDEATGIKALQLTLQQIQRKLTTTQQHAHELQAIITELEPRKRVLERQVTRQHQRQQIEVQLQQTEEQWFVSYWQALHRKLAQTQEERIAAEKHFSAAAAERKAEEQQAVARLQAYAGKPSVLQAELRGAHVTYERSRQTYSAAQHRKQQLQGEIKELEEEHRQARLSLETRRHEALAFDWLAQIRALLRQCQGVLEKMTVHEVITETETENLLTKVIQTVASLDDTKPLESARALMQQLEKPVQTAARLEALLSAKKQQLDELTSPPLPSKEYIEQLEKSLHETGSTEDSPLENLEIFRQRELQASQALALLQSKENTCMADIQDHQRVILRQRGQDFFTAMESSKKEVDKTLIVSREEVEHLRGSLAALGEIDPLALPEYNEVLARHQKLMAQLQDIETATAHIKEAYQELELEIQQTFSEQFKVIRQSFQHYINRFFEGGTGQLVILEEGIDMTVHLPGKKVTSLHAFSGGEKTLVSLALLLAVIDAQKPPFLVLDEVDAALDEANARRFALALKEKSEHIQCIMITHNRETMSQADILYGVTMNEQALSKVYSLRLQDLT